MYCDGVKQGIRYSVSTCYYVESVGSKGFSNIILYQAMVGKQSKEVDSTPGSLFPQKNTYAILLLRIIIMRLVKYTDHTLDPPFFVQCVHFTINTKPVVGH